METGFSPIAQNPTASGDASSNQGFLALTIVASPRSKIKNDTGYDNDVDSTNRPRSVLRRQAGTYFPLVYQGVTTTQKNDIIAFMEATRGADNIPFLFDGLLIKGQIVKSPSISRIAYDQYEIAIEVKAQTVGIA